MEPHLVTPILIVRDEERTLPGALDSLVGLLPVVGRACVYDTGSVDRTVTLAQAAGADLEQGYWDDDFARARNAAASMARNAWVLTIDADERVMGNAALLSAAVRLAEEKGLDSLVVEVDDVRDGRPVNTSPSVRLFRPAKAMYRNRIHEVVARRDGQPLRSARLPRSALYLRHVGYGLVEGMERRQERNTRIGNLEVEAARHQGRDSAALLEALVNRGRSRSMGGDWEAAIPDWQEARSLPVRTDFHLYAGELLARALIETDRQPEAAELLRALRVEGSDPHLMAWLAARAFTLTGRPEQTVQALRNVREPVSALGERHSIAPVLETRLLAAAAVGHIDLAVDDAVRLMTEFGTSGIGRLLLLLWGDRPTEQLVERFTTTHTKHLADVADEFESLGPQGKILADAVRRSAARGPA